MSLFHMIERALDKAPPEDDIQAQLDAQPFMGQYKRMIALSAVGIGLALASLAAFYSLAKTVRPPQLILISQPGPQTQARAPGGQGPLWDTETLTPMLLPNQSQSTIQGWAREVTQKVYTFDFLNIDTQLGSAKSYFTPDGWVAFTKAMKNSELVKTVEKNKVSVSITPIAEPIISSAAVTGGAEYAWKVICPVMVSYSGDMKTTTEEMIINVTIIRVPTTENPKGLGVVQLFARSAKS